MKDKYSKSFCRKTLTLKVKVIFLQKCTKQIACEGIKCINFEKGWR